MNAGVGMRHKFRIGHVCSLIIAFLEITCILYKLFEVNIPILESFIGIIEDCSTILTLICVSFGVTSLTGTPKAYSLTVLCLVDIILLNDLYSNKRQLKIVQWISSRKIIFVIALVVVCVIVAIVTWRILSRKKNTRQRMPYDYIENLEDMAEETSGSNFEGQRNSDKNSLANNKVKNKDKPAIKALNIVLWICMAAGAFIVLWGVLDYLLFAYLELDLVRPHFVSWDPDYLYYAAVISFSGFLVLAVLYNLVKTRNSHIDDNDEHPAFSGSAIVAFLIEILLIIVANEINISALSDSLLSAVTDNLFSFFISIVLIFLVLQIICTVVYHLATKKKSGDKIFDLVKSSMLRIEERLVKLAFSLIEGCVKLFDFIPDFFDTIGIILLDNKQTEQDEEDEKGPEGSDREAKAGGAKEPDNR